MLITLVVLLLVFSCATQNVQIPAIDVHSDAIYYTKPIVKSADVSVTDEGFFVKKGNGFASILPNTKFWLAWHLAFARIVSVWKLLNSPCKTSLPYASNQNAFCQLPIRSQMELHSRIVSNLFLNPLRRDFLYPLLHRYSEVPLEIYNAV